MFISNCMSGSRGLVIGCTSITTRRDSGPPLPTGFRLMLKACEELADSSDEDSGGVDGGVKGSR